MLKKGGLRSGSEGAYTLARRLILPPSRVSHAMPLPSGRHRSVLRTRSHAWWCDSLSFRSMLSWGIRMAVPPVFGFRTFV